MAVRLTAAQARALGVETRARTRTTRHESRPDQCAPNRCTTCGEQFTGETAERRHADSTGHLRFEMVLERDGDAPEGTSPSAHRAV